MLTLTKQTPPPGFNPFAKPVNINDRSIEQVLRGYLNVKEPKVARFLSNTWNAEQAAIKFEEISAAVASGQLQPEWIEMWRQDYSRFINDNLDVEWRAAQQSGAGHMVEKMAEKLGITVTMPEVAARLEAWIAERGATLIVQLTTDQELAIRNVLNHFVVDLGVGPRTLDPILRPMVGLTSREAGAVTKFRTALVEEGIAPKLINKKAQDYAGLLNRRRGIRIARTEIASAYNQGAFEGMRQAVDQRAIIDPIAKVWQTAEDERVCPWCGPLNQTVIELERNFEPIPIVGRKLIVFSGSVPPLHPLCLPGDSRIATKGISTACKRWYDGDFIIIYTASGNKLACTPHHPILTNQGFVAASALNITDNIISNRFIERKFISNVDYENIPPCAKDVFESFVDNSQVFAIPVPSSPEDFHGDGIAGNINIVWADSKLLGSLNSTIVEHSNKSSFTSGDSYLSKLSSLGSFNFLRQGVFSSMTGFMRSFRESLAFAGAGLRHTCEHGFAAVSSRNIVFNQNTIDDSTTNSVELSKFFYRNTGDVFFDKIVRVDVSNFCGHVYSFETESGVIIADNLTTSNCRCAIIYQVWS